MATGLPWVRVDSDLAQNPKIADLIANHGARGKSAAFVFVCGIGYAAAHNTDGEIRKAILPFIHGTPADARLLVEAGLWEVADKGWLVTNYSSHQPTRATREALSEAGKRGAAKRWGKEET